MYFRRSLQAGVEMFPQSAYMVLLHGNFMIDVLGISQSGSRRIEVGSEVDDTMLPVRAQQPWRLLFT